MGAEAIQRPEEKGGMVTLSPRCKNKIVDQGSDAAYGAQPLRRDVATLLGDGRDQEVIAARSGSRCNSKHGTPRGCWLELPCSPKNVRLITDTPPGTDCSQDSEFQCSPLSTPASYSSTASE